MLLCDNYPILAFMSPVIHIISSDCLIDGLLYFFIKLFYVLFIVILGLSICLYYVMLNSFPCNLTIITLLDIGQCPMIDLAILFFISILTSFLCSCPPEYNII